MRNRIILWRVNRAMKRNQVFKVCRLLNVTVGDKTEAQLIKALVKAHRNLIDSVVVGRS